ncbi:hypothetical protein [Neoaquamicrobium sediminum]|uniref:hypothetical protein n=1 Tax=Neoaquamicrobium sediminum TaxID=1849104 RepID=UPI0015679D0D|nr:hypothetical protein [Mesorhizobium sediminum]NRC54172.1 hypothetical protein [Mesorhizobium sediminum]
MTTPDEALVRKLDLNARDALITAYRNEDGRIRVEADTVAHNVTLDLAKRGLLDDTNATSIRQDGPAVREYEITGRGKRVARLLPENSGKPLETLWIKIAPSEGTEGGPHWISVDGFDIVALENAEQMTDQFYMLQPHIPDGWRPVQMERVKPEEVE